MRLVETPADRPERVSVGCETMDRYKAAPEGAVNTDEGLTTTTVWSHDG